MGSLISAIVFGYTAPDRKPEPSANDLTLAVGDTYTFSKEILASDFSCAGPQGDISPRTVEQQEVADEAVLLGYMSRCSTQMAERACGNQAVPVSVGYEHVRFFERAKVGETITVTHTVVQIDNSKREVRSSVKIRTSRATILEADYAMGWVPRT